jgi:hypothetical protein
LHTPIIPRLRHGAALLWVLAAPAVLAHDYPTIDRVLYVQSCLRDHPGPAFEMLNKCSCVIDRLAEKLSYDEFVDLSTEANATTIGGERGAVLRENEGVQKDVRRFRALVADAKKSCLFRIDPK